MNSENQATKPNLKGKRGMALVLVLAALALISFLVLVILTMARTEDRTSTADAEISDVRTLADMPAQIVISQIRKATTDLGVHFTWASQPGMIRVYGNGVDGNGGVLEGTPRVKAHEFYKLYSSKRMTEDSSYDATKAADEVANWSSSPAQFTDLNEPVEITPTQIARSKSQRETSEKTYIYPILDPSAENSVDGFAVNPPNSGGSRVAMPVRWLYVLKDGKVVAPTGGSGAKASFGNGPSEENPIVGRIAFWADDESCKLNINTASEPAPWDTPRTNSKTDHLYAQNQPARNEFHRQSGHPAFTALSPVFKSFVGEKTTPTSSSQNSLFTPKPDPNGDDSQDGAFRDYVSAVHSLLPRRAINTERTSYHGTRDGTREPLEPAKLKKERLYATIDELLFSAEAPSDGKRQQNSTADGGPGNYLVTQHDINRSRFFLTTKNSAPETSPINRPKISLWTVQQPEGAFGPQTPLDKGMCMAASFGRGENVLTKSEYFFQRLSTWQKNGAAGSSQNAYQDINIPRNLDIYSALQAFTSFQMPGYAGASLLGKYSLSDLGSGGEPDRDRLLISMFDMLRWGVNPGDSNEQSSSAYSYAPPIAEEGSFPCGEAGASSAVPSVLVPERSHAVRGLGRFPTITEVALVFVATDGERTSQNAPLTDTNPQDNMADKTKKMRMFLILEPFIAAPGSPSAAPAVSYTISGLENWKIMEGKNEHTLFEDEYPNENHVLNFMGKDGLLVLDGGTALNGLTAQFLKRDGSPKDITDGGLPPDGSPPPQHNPAVAFPFVSREIIFEDGVRQDGRFTFVAAPITIEIKAALNPGGNHEPVVLQRIRVPMPSTSSIPIPWMPTDEQADPKQRIQTRFELQLNAGTARQNLIIKGDVVRSVEMAPYHNESASIEPEDILHNRSLTDYRLLASAGAGNRGGLDFPITFEGDGDNISDGVKIAPELFPSLDYVAAAFNSNERAIHTLRSGHNLLGGQFGTAIDDSLMPTIFTSGIRFNGNALAPTEGLPPELSVPVTAPDLVRLPASLVRSKMLTFHDRYGDFDNGPGLIEDGPYVGRFDFGNTFNEALSSRTAQIPPYGGYFQRGGLFMADTDNLNFAPLRQISSAISFGSLPSQVHAIPRPWTTLLFCPNPNSRTTAANAPKNITTEDHFGFGIAGSADGSKRAVLPDHLWLEYFWMPVVEPRLLSVAFSTEGKVNMNYQIMPFTWIKRSTAMRGALQGVRIAAVPSADTTQEAFSNGMHYKVPKTPGEILDKEYRYTVNAEETLKGFEEQRFKDGEIFRTPSEICEMFLIPEKPATNSSQTKLDLRLGNIMAFWNGTSNSPLEVNDSGHEATGDNTREAPYAQLYPRLCTKSNVFRVHYRVQLLKKSRSTSPAEWDSTKDMVAAEYRGSTLVERYLDPNDSDIPDMVGTINTSDALDDYFRFRVVEKQPFAP